MRLESLEQRRLLSVSLVNHVLMIVGTDHDDSVVLSVKGKDTIVRTSFDAEKHFHLKPGDSIQINLLGGNDRTAINNLIRFPATILGGNGNDSLCGGGGNDQIDGGTGADSLNGGEGDDRLIDTSGSTQIQGGPGFDAADFSLATSPVNFNMSGKGLEILLGGAGADSLTGSSADDIIVGNAGRDTISGMGGDDLIDGGRGQDKMLGNDGNDLFVSQDGETDTIDGGAGYNFAQEDKNNAGTSLDKRTNIAQFFDKTVAPVKDQHGAKQDSSVPQAAASALVDPVVTTQSLQALAVSTLAAAPATLSGGILTVNGTAAGDAISVILDASGKNISVSVNAASASFPLAGVKQLTINGNDGSDAIALQRSDGTRAISIPSTIVGGNGNDRIIGGKGSDLIYGGNGNDSLLGMAGNDKIEGNLGNDTIDGGDGDDLLNGTGSALTTADGPDVIRGGGGFSDTVDYSTRFNPVSVDISNSSKANDGEKGEGDQVFADVENIFGGNGNDTLIGNTAANLISGGNGNDNIIGNGGHDKFIGGKGADSITAGADASLFSILDFTRDNFNGTLDASGRPLGSFISGDIGTDFSTASRGILQ